MKLTELISAVIEKSKDKLKESKNLIAMALLAFFEELTGDFKTALHKLSTGELKVEVEHKGFDGIVRSLQKIARLIILAILLSALLLSSALLLLAGLPPKWENFSVWGLGGLLISLWVAFRLYTEWIKEDNHRER